MTHSFPTLEELLLEESQLAFNPGAFDAVKFGLYISKEISDQNEPLSLIVRQTGRTIFQIAHAGSHQINDTWMLRKARVAEVFGHSSLYVRLEHESTGRPYESHGLNLDDYAFFGGGYPLKDHAGRVFGSVGVSGTLQLPEHKFLVDVITKFKNSTLK